MSKNKIYYINICLILHSAYYFIIIKSNLKVEIY